MSDYSKTVDFAAKDSLPPGDPNKVALGAQVNTEFANIQIAVATKADVPASPNLNEIAVTTAGGDLTNSGLYATGGEILDANGNELLEFGTTTSAVATLKVTNAATGNNPILSTSSSVAGADIGMTLSDTNNNELLILTSVDSAVNEITVTNAASGNRPSINQTGSGNVGLDIEGLTIANGTITAATITTLTSTTLTSTTLNSRAATPRRVLIESQTISGTPSYVTFITSIDSTYKEFEFQFINCIPTADGGIFGMQFSIDASTFYSSNYCTDSTTGEGYIRLSNTAGVSNVVAEGGISGVAYVSNPASADHNKLVSCLSKHSLPTVNTTSGATTTGKYYGHAQAINGIRFQFSGTTFQDYGYINMYGVT